MKRALIFLLVFAAVAAADVSFVNPGFESGGLSGWSVLGNVMTAGPLIYGFGPNVYSINPNETTMAQLTTAGGVDAADIEAAMLLPAGYLGTIVPDVTNASAAWQDVTLTAADVALLGYWAFITADDDEFDDTAVAVAVSLDDTNSVVSVKLACLACADAWHTVGSFGGVPWEFLAFGGGPGNWRLGFVVANARDTSGDTFLFLDDGLGGFTVHNAVPEPGTYALLGAGLALVGLLRRRCR